MKNEKSKHTPGPWTATIDREISDKCFIDALPDCPPVALTMGKDMEANARLIAGAPDLLAALENVLSAVAYDDGPARDILNLDEIRAAIAKAKGE